MACENCKCPTHEQFKNYAGRWICFRPGPTIGRIICQTLAADFDDFQAHNRKLAEAKTPRWCPGAIPKEG